jgi:hypothetical protein
MKLNDLIAKLNELADEFGESEVSIVVGEYETFYNILDVDYTINIELISCEGETPIKYSECDKYVLILADDKKECSDAKEHGCPPDGCGGCD